MTKATAKAPANIAFIKYWGKKNRALRLPLNSSISMNLSNCFTVTTVEFSPDYQEDQVQLIDKKQHVLFFVKRGKESKREKEKEKEKERVIKHLDRIREKAGIGFKAKVITKNSFPASAGIASSASGFAALTLAGTKAAGLNLSERELSILARLGSGSACRSISDGFVEWKKGKTSQDSYAYSLYSSDYWDLRDIIAIASKGEKKIGSSRGMAQVKTSPFLKARLRGVEARTKRLKKALKDKNFRALGKIIEEEAINMHTVMMTQKPPLFYWNRATMDIIQSVQKWRRQDLSVYFTIDAGPNVHLICQGKDEKEVVERIKALNGILDVIINKPTQGARLIKKHLF